MSKFSDDIYYGYPEVKANKALNDILFDDHSSPKKYTKTFTISMTPEMYQAIQELVQHPDLPFEGNMSAFGRHVVAAGIESLDKWLEEDVRTIFRALIRQQRRLTRERLIVTIDDAIAQQVDSFQLWSAHGKWKEIVRQLKRFVDETSDYPIADWREHASRVFLRHPGMRALLRGWQTRMKEDDPDMWNEVQKVYRKLERMSGDA